MNTISYKVNQPVELEKIIELLHKPDYLPIEDISNTNHDGNRLVNAAGSFTNWNHYLFT